MKVGIIGAMASEVALLKERLTEAQVTRVAGMEFCEGALGGTPVVVVHAEGIGFARVGRTEAGETAFRSDSPANVYRSLVRALLG